jgi:hypothetical protein
VLAQQVKDTLEEMDILMRAGLALMVVAEAQADLEQQAATRKVVVKAVLD